MMSKSSTEGKKYFQNRRVEGRNWFMLTTEIDFISAVGGGINSLFGEFRSICSQFKPNRIR